MLANSLKTARVNKGLNQQEVADALGISRQAISKWENNKTYPDIDNLVLLSELYEVSLDDLVKEQRELTEQLHENQVKQKSTHQKLNVISKEMAKKQDEGLMLLVISLVSAFIPFLGIIIPVYVMWRNAQNNSFYRLIFWVSGIVILVSMWNIGIIVDDVFFTKSDTSITLVN